MAGREAPAPRACPRSEADREQGRFSSVTAGTTPSLARSLGSAPMNTATTGLPALRVSAPMRDSTLSAGGLDTSRMIFVTGSWMRALKASTNMMPPTSFFTSLPPVPMAWEIPAPSLEMAQVVSWRPVPAAETTPMPPPRTTLAKAKGAPLMSRAAVRAHDHEPFLGRELLELDLGLQGHVVREDHHVQSLFQALHGLVRGVRARDRDERDVGPWQGRERGFKAPGPDRACGRVLLPGSFEQFLGAGHGRDRQFLGLGLDRDEEVRVPGRGELGGKQA